MPPNPSGSVVWFTGVPGAGKTTLARRVKEHLDRLRNPCVLLDGDATRAALVPRHGYEPEQRDAFYATLANLAAMLAAQGTLVLVPATAHLRRFRERARALTPRFIEVHVAASHQDAIARDATRGQASIYAHAAPGQVPGRDLSYEPPLAAEVTIDASNEHRAVELVLARLAPDQQVGTNAQAGGLRVISRDTYVGISLVREAHLPQQQEVCQRLGLIPRPELHVTLAYLGEVEFGRLAAFHAGLMASEIPWEDIRLRITGLGAALEDGAGPRVALKEEELRSSPVRPRVVWWSIELSKALATLRQQVLSAIQQAGIADTFIRSNFWPHVTLGSAGPADAGDWAMWDDHTVEKVATLGGAETLTEAQAQVAHVTNSSIHPQSLLPLYSWQRPR